MSRKGSMSSQVNSGVGRFKIMHAFPRAHDRDVFCTELYMTLAIPSYNQHFSSPSGNFHDFVTKLLRARNSV